MVSSRFTSFLFGLIVFISLNSFAYSHQDVEKQMVAAANALVLAGGSPLSLQKEIFDAVPTPAEARNIEDIVGRKMMKMKVVALKKETLKVGGVNVETAVSKGKSTSKQITTSITSRRHRIRGNHHHMKLEVRLGSFVALNADYHVPKSHPPKNN